jgi:hypothetical protein
LLQKSTFVDCNEGTLVVLGFGLLLRECWRAVEAEDDDENAPKFLQESLLGKKRAKQVIQAVKEAISKLPLSFTDDEERQVETEFDSGTKGKKAKHGQKNPMAKSPAHPPSPTPSTSKQSGVQKGNDGPIQNIRSQRQRKPSKKLRDAD